MTKMPNGIPDAHTDHTSPSDYKATFELRGITKVYNRGKVKTQALRYVTLKCRAGEIICIAGPSGSGKTTLLNILGCLDSPTEGDVIIDDELVLHKKRNEIMELRKNKIGFIFQNFNLVPVFNVFENIEYPLTLQNISAKKRGETVNRVLEEVGLTHRATHYPNELSGGECQRVSIARALVKRPKLIIADEPTANLDTTTGLKILELMRKLNNGENITIVFATHDQQAMEMSDTVISLRDGMIGR